MKKVIRIVLGTLFSLAILACDIGLGEIVDIDAPEITLSKMVSGTAGVEETEANTKRNFDGTIFTKQEVSFYGEASDNVGVTRVHVEIKWLEDTDYVFFKDATISGNAWSVNLLFPKEGACWLKFIVSDRAGNFGSMSSRVIALYVDNDAPIGDAWYIDRLINGIQYNFKSYASLYKLVEEDDPKLLNPTNKDVAQNGTFNVCGTLTDSIGVADGMTLTLEPYNPADPKISGIGISSETSSNYAPKFKISPEMDINGISCKLPESGKHYYQIKYSASDLVTDPAPNVVTDAEVSAGWFLWWPESDVPKCYISNADADTDEIKIYTSDSLNITIFDDDALSGEVKCELKKGADIISSKTETISGSTTRETNIIMQAPDRPQILTLSVRAKDINGKELNKVYSVFVTDDFTPTLILTSPENNQIPSVTGNDADINFTGITLDKAGCKYLEFVWVPDSVKTNVTEKNALAVAWLDQIAGEGKHELYVPAGENKVKVTSGTGAFAGCKLWSAKLTDAGFENSFIKHTFSFNISALNNFADDKTKEKNFIARVTREDGNYSDTELKLAADNLVPEIQIINPTGNMGIIDQDVDLVIKFSAKKSSGIQIKECRLSYVSPDNAETPLTISESNGIYTSEVISKSTLANYFSSNINPKYRIYAEDVLGNKNTVTYQFIISSLPQIKTVTSSAPEKCKKDDVISINVSFSKVVTIPDGDVPVLRLKNIKNTTTGLTEGQEIEGTYKEGSGTTTLIFEYKVKEGDISQGLQVYNEAGVGPIKGLNKNSTYVHLATLTDENNLQKKRSGNPIKIDGVLPKVNGVSLRSTDAASENKKEGTTYLKAGRTITADVTTDKKVTVQGSPVFTLVSDADSSKKINLSFKTVSSDGETITFEGKIADTDGNGKYSYDADGYLNDASIFKDEYGNALVVPAANGNVSTVFFIDTKKPKKPEIKNSSGTETLAPGKYKDSVTFTVSTEISDTTTYTEYSDDAGKTWYSYSGAVTVNSSASIVARTTDYAGNVSDYSDVIDLDLNSSFPAFTVECTNPDGNFKCGTVLEFKVSFANAVNIAANAGAYIQLSDNNTTDKFTGKAYLKDKTAKSGVTEAVFTYTTQNKDDFTLKIAQAGVVLTGFTDQYGVGQGNKSLTADYTRPSLHCDSVAPYVVTMVPGGTPTTQNNLKAYSGAKTITLTFSENVSAVSGNIYLRQTNGWAIPPMFTADEFNKVLNAAKSAAIDPSKTNNLTASQVLYMDGLEDAESLYGSTTGPANDRYHGTAQYAGPYKKMTNGVNNSGNPDLSVKYVLDFSLDIWDSNKAMLTKYVGNEGESVNEPRFGKTYEDHDNTNVLRYHHLSRAGLVKVLTPENKITTDSIRYVLEQAHLHERYMAVDSSYVIVSGNTVTLNFPDGLLGDSDLPPGREWELVIEEGAFMDETGNQFGYEYSGNALAPTTGNRIQIANNGTTEGTWGRRNESTGTPVVLIQDGNNVAFMSAGVAKPVIRVDRYSYGLGIKQPVLQSGQQLWKPLNGDITYQKIDSIGNGANPNLQTGSTAPTGIVGVRIDTESKGAKIRFSYNNDVKNKSDVSPSRTDGNATNTYSVSSKTLPSAPSTSYSESYSSGIVFLAGSGLLTTKTNSYGNSLFQSCKQYIKADALYSDSVTSFIAQEGIFQTIVNISSPAHNGGGNTIYNAGQGRQVLNIHGTTGLSGEPTIAPFPLRDQPVGSAYMRQTYQDEDQYYWLSYEVFVDSCYSMYVFGQYAYGGFDEYGVTGYKKGWGDWAQNYGLMAFGEFNVCTGMKSWPAKSGYTNNADIVPDNGNAD